MSIAIWIVTAVVAGMFAIAGLVKIFSTRTRLLDQGMDYVEDYSDETIKVIGGLEILAAVGLIVPGLLGVATFLVPLSAIGLVLIMIGAIAVHIRRGERDELPMNLILLVGALFVAVMRIGPNPL